MKTLFKYMLSVYVVFCIYSLAPLANAVYSDPYTFDESTGTITDCETSVSGRLEVPSEINGHVVTTIGNQAFRQCYQLTEIVLPNTITRIDGWAFAYCEGLKSVTLPSSVEYYSPSFFRCSNMMAINVSDANPYFCSADGVLFSKDMKKLIEYPHGKGSSYQIPSGVEIIGEGAFEWRSRLRSISIPQSINTIETLAFSKCFNISDIYYQGTEDQWNEIQIADFNQWNENVTIHYNSYLNDENEDRIGHFVYSNGEFLSDFSIEFENNQRAYLMFWHNYGDSPSDEDFIFTWEADKWQYELVGNRSRKLFDVSFIPTENGMRIRVICKDGEYYSWETMQRSRVWIDAEYKGFLSSFDTPSSWAVEEIEDARENGLIPESLDEKYQNNITRQEFCQLAVKLIEVSVGNSIDDVLEYHGVLVNELQFDDTDDKNILAMNALRIVSGVGDGKFEPNRAIKREEAATMLTRLGKVLDGKLPQNAMLNFADKTSVSDWAYYSVMFVSNNEDENGRAIMGGTGNNQFSPQETYTREQAFLSFDRLYHVVEKCTIAKMHIEQAIDESKIKIRSRNNYLTANHLLQDDNHRVLWMSHDSSGDGSYDEILVYTPTGYLPNNEYEVWVKPIENNEIPVMLNGSTEGSINTCGTGAALITVQSPVSGTIWESFYVYSCDISSQCLLGTQIPEAIANRTKTNFYTAGMYVENYKTEKSGSGDQWHVMMDVYNIASIYGAVDIYDKDNQYIESYRIEKNKALPENLPDVFEDAWGLVSDLFDGDVLTYRQEASSTPTHLDFYVPEGGYVVFSNNGTKSFGAAVYNFTDFFIEGISATVKGLSLSNKDWDAVANSFSEGLLKAIADKSKNFAEDESLNFIEWINSNYNTTDAGQYMANWVSQGIKAFDDIGIDVSVIFLRSLSEISGNEIAAIAETALENAFGQAGNALQVLFYVSDLGNYAVQLDHFRESPETKPIYIVYPWVEVV